MDAVVVGGGIIGLASAHELAERGVDVTLVERATIGGGNTERSIGGIRTQFSTPVNVDLSLAALEVWENFAEQFGVDIAHRQHGYLFLARTPETAENFETDVAMQRERGVPSELLDPEEAVAHCDALDPAPFEAATYCGRDGYADPHLAVQGYATAIADSAVTVRTGTALVDVHREGGPDAGSGPVEAVTIAEGRGGPERLDCEFVVNAAGAWAAEVGDLVGLELPVEAKRRQMVVVEPETPVPETDPLVIDLDTGSHFRPERDGAAIVGGHFGGPDPAVDPGAIDRSHDLEWAASAVERAGEYVSYFGPATRIRRGWAGCYAVTPDHHPIIEETTPGFVNAVGFSGHGFQHAPATGRLVAELVVDGEASLVDIGDLSADRFEGGSPLAERNVA